MLLAWLALLALALAHQRPVAAALEAYTGREPADARSTRFTVALAPAPAQHGVPRTGLPAASAAPPLAPMVYMTASPDEELAKIHKGPDGQGLFCSLHGAQFCNRTLSWVDFSSGTGTGTASSSSAAVSIVVTSLRGAVFKDGFTLASTHAICV